jgi:light-independent protochlorophyllide reductase subunit L
MDPTPDVLAVQAEYIQLATTLWGGTEGREVSAMKDRDIFDFLGFD